MFCKKRENDKRVMVGEEDILRIMLEAVSETVGDGISDNQSRTEIAFYARGLTDMTNRVINYISDIRDISGGCCEFCVEKKPEESK